MQELALGSLSFRANQLGFWHKNRLPSRLGMAIFFVGAVLLHLALVGFFLQPKPPEPLPMIQPPAEMVAWLELAPENVMVSEMLPVTPEPVKEPLVEPITAVEEHVLAEVAPQKVKPIDTPVERPIKKRPPQESKPLVKPVTTAVEKTLEAVAAKSTIAAAELTQSEIQEPKIEAVVPAKAVAAEPEETLVEAQANYLVNPLPTYSRLSKKMGETGTVLLRVQVSPLGETLSVQLEKSSGFSRLDESALTTVSQWRFKAATKGGVAVSSWVVVPVKFVLN